MTICWSSVFRLGHAKIAVSPEGKFVATRIAFVNMSFVLNQSLMNGNLQIVSIVMSNKTIHKYLNINDYHLGLKNLLNSAWKYSFKD